MSLVDGSNELKLIVILHDKTFHVSLVDGSNQLKLTTILHDINSIHIVLYAMILISCDSYQGTI